MCEILDDLKMNFETHHDIYLPAGQCWHMIYTLTFLFKNNKKRKQAKRNLMSTLEIRDVLDGISETCSMKVYFYIWTLTWINIWRIEETTKYCEWNWGIYYYCYYYLFIGVYGILCCAAMILYANLAFSCIDRFIPTVTNLFWCVFVYIYLFYLFVVCRIC